MPRLAVQLGLELPAAQPDPPRWRSRQRGSESPLAETVCEGSPLELIYLQQRGTAPPRLLAVPGRNVPKATGMPHRSLPAKPPARLAGPPLPPGVFRRPFRNRERA